jgi:erythromycin esterase-like protein
VAVLAGNPIGIVLILSVKGKEEEMKGSAFLKPGLLATLLLSVTLTASDQPEVTWVRDNAVKLQTVEANHGFADMKPIAKIAGNARIVSLGEAAHGTREFFRLKHRMLEFLATEMGFNIFSIEANMPEAYRLNDFVLK